MNAEDSERKYDDISDYSQSMMHFFPHFYHSAKDSSIATQLYCRNVYHTHSIRTTCFFGRFPKRTRRRRDVASLSFT